MDLHVSMKLKESKKIFKNSVANSDRNWIFKLSSSFLSGRKSNVVKLLLVVSVVVAATIILFLIVFEEMPFKGSLFINQTKE